MVVPRLIRLFAMLHPEVTVFIFGWIFGTVFFVSESAHFFADGIDELLVNVPFQASLSGLLLPELSLCPDTHIIWTSYRFVNSPSYLRQLYIIFKFIALEFSAVVAVCGVYQKLWKYLVQEQLAFCLEKNCINLGLSMIASKAKYYGTPKSIQLLRVLTYLMLATLLNDTLASQHYCGETLSAAMRLVCYNGFNGKPVKRISTFDHSMDFDDNSLANDIINLNFTNTTQSLKYPGLTTYTDQSLVISLPSHNLSGIMSKLFKGKRMAMTQTRRRRFTSSGGIHSECCLKKCTISEMRGYCL